jgi:predicted metalloprotease with PDZ domain
MVLGAGAASGRAHPLRVRFDNADHHESEVTTVFSSVPGGVLELAMSRSSPGRYALHEFAKNVYRLRAEDGAGRSLEVSRSEPSRGDRLLELAGRQVGKDRTPSEALDALSPGDRVSISFDKRGERRKAEVVLQGDPAIEVVSFEQAGREVTPAVARFRENWLSSRAAGN